MTRNSNIVNAKSDKKDDVGNEIICNTEMLKSNLRDYNEGYFLVKGDITVTAVPGTQVVFKKSYTLMYHKIDGTTLNNAENLDLVVPMYNLLEYSSLWFHSKGEATNFDAHFENTNAFKSF